ncbi:MAG: 2Fe-2S iron-sulfur cluster binding domain-containing protein, partial [Actinobacteria bacterium]|nr:2Fe-2S iron-sulfur cluster binding domain-containing protein [Actinomycetota bacterium]
MIVQKQFSIKFLPSKKTIKVPKDYNLRQAALDCGIDIESSCGGVGTCGRCKVQVKNGHVQSKRSKFITSDEKKRGYVLSCLAKVKSNLTVFIHEKKVKKAKIEEGQIESVIGKIYSGIEKDVFAAVEIKPWIIKERIKVEKPTLNYNINDFYRLQKSIKNKLKIENIAVPIKTLRKLPLLLRESDWEVIITLDKS